MVEKYLSETDIKKLLQCSRCKQAPNSPPVYMCRTGHHECSACFEKQSEGVLLEETDGSTDTESESGSVRKGDSSLGVIFPESSKPNSRGHSCAICKDEVTKTRNFLAESLITQLEASKSNSRIERTNFLAPMKINVQETKVQATNYVDCCYNIYGSPCERYDTQNMPISTYDPQAFSRYQIPCGIQQYDYTVNPYVMPPSPQPQIEYEVTNGYYPEYDTMAYYGPNGRKDPNDRRGKVNCSNQISVVSLNGKSSKRLVALYCCSATIADTLRRQFTRVWQIQLGTARRSAMERRPIRCPTHMCGRNIAVAALSSHFCFDHPEVPPLHVDFDVNSHLFIDPEMIPFNYGRCVAILLIPNKCEAISTVSHPNIITTNKVKNSLPLVVMASKLDFNTSTQPSLTGLNEEGQPECLNHGDFQSAGNGKSRLLVIWLAGVDMSSAVNTTIQVTEKQTNVRSVIYTGPIMSLRASQNTSKVLEQGDCLVIHSGILENIIGNKGGFDLHVMVH